LSIYCCANEKESAGCYKLVEGVDDNLETFLGFYVTVRVDSFGCYMLCLFILLPTLCLDASLFYSPFCYFAFKNSPLSFKPVTYFKGFTSSPFLDWRILL